MFRTRASCTIHPMNKRLRGPLRYLEATFQATLIVANKEERKTEKGNEYSTLRHCPSICPRRFLYLSYLTYFFFFQIFYPFTDDHVFIPLRRYSRRSLFSSVSRRERFLGRFVKIFRQIETTFFVKTVSS